MFDCQQNGVFLPTTICSWSPRSTNTQSTLSLQIYLLSHDQLQISEQYRIFSRQGFLIRSALYSEAERKLLHWEYDNRNSVKPSDNSVLHFDCYVPIYLNVYQIFIYLCTCLFLFHFITFICSALPVSTSLLTLT